MKLLITGAGGFLGQYVTSEAVNRGHRVRALLRPSSKRVPEGWGSHPSIEVARGDLRNRRVIPELLADCDAVIHLAAVKAGDLYEQFGGTVIATENLLSAMEETEIRRMVLISSFSVYEYMKRPGWSIIDEKSPLAIDPFKRDEYCQTKMMQERIALESAKRNGWRCVALRPGVIYGRDNLWTARLGSQSREHKWISIGRFAPLPLTYVENCASAILLAVEYDGPEQTPILNVVDGTTPSQRTYINFLKKNMAGKIGIVGVPWMLMRFLARTAWLFNRIFLKGHGKFPGLLVPDRLHARCKPFRYPNRKIVSTLGWVPRFTWKEGVLRSLSDVDLISLQNPVADSQA